MKIGILALQGDFINHFKVLSQLGVDPILVKSPQDLAAIEGIVIPGGESTTISKLLVSSGVYDPLKERLDNGLAGFGTCAGMIILSRVILDGRSDQVALSSIDISVRRNGFGRQVASFETDIDVAGISGGSMRAAFMRAPVVEEVGSSVEILSDVSYRFPDSSTRKVPVICRERNILVCSFHPEIVGDDRLHRLFLDIC